LISVIPKGKAKDVPDSKWAEALYLLHFRMGETFRVSMGKNAASAFFMVNYSMKSDGCFLGTILVILWYFYGIRTKLIQRAL